MSILPGGVMVRKPWPLHFLGIMPGGVMVARRTLDAEIGVQIPAGQQISLSQFC